eukprot:gene9069-biopygen3096
MTEVHDVRSGVHDVPPGVHGVRSGVHDVPPGVLWGYNRRPWGYNWRLWGYNWRPWGYNTTGGQPHPWRRWRQQQKLNPGPRNAENALPSCWSEEER